MSLQGDDGFLTISPTMFLVPFVEDSLAVFSPPPLPQRRKERFVQAQEESKKN